MARRLPPLAADGLSNVAIMLRSASRLWRFGHFFAVRVIGSTTSRPIINWTKDPGFAVVLPLTSWIALPFAVNLYLMMSAVVICHKCNAHKVIWRWRFLVDCVLSARLAASNVRDDTAAGVVMEIHGGPTAKPSPAGVNRWPIEHRGELAVLLRILST